MRYRHSITGIRYVKQPGSAGQSEWKPVVGPSLPPVRCNVHPLSTEEIQFYGDRGRDTRKVFARSWPFDIHSRLTFDGAEWDQVEPEQVADLGVRTQHVEVIIRKR